MPYRYPKRSQYKYTKKPYRVRNWSAYETALRKRGELTLWFSKEAIQAWHAPSSGKPGGQRVYSDLAIETALTRALHKSDPSGSHLEGIEVMQQLSLDGFIVVHGQHELSLRAK